VEAKASVAEREYPSFSSDTGVVPQGSALFVYSRSLNRFDVLNLKSVAHLQLIDGRRSMGDIVCELRSRFPSISPRLIASDATSLVSFMVRRGYLVLNSGQGGRSFPLEYSESWSAPKVVHLDVELTKNCNLRCKYCYDSAASGFDCLPLEEWTRLFGRLQNQGLRAVKLSGGEPLCHPQFAELLRWTSGRLIVTVNSNGTLIDDATADLMAMCDLQAVQVSLDSPTPQVNDKMRGAGSWDAAVAGIRRLRGHDVPVRIACTVHAGNESLVVAMREFASDMGASIVFEVMKPVGSADQIGKSAFVKDACRITQQNSYDEYCGMNFFEVKCQAELGFAGLTHRGELKPCNLTSDFFSRISADVVGPVGDVFAYASSSTFSTVSAACATGGPRRLDDHGFPACVLE
jgi:MoaA/NifB/PqqE/SkfB family radical SAM enzyme